MKRSASHLQFIIPGACVPKARARTKTLRQGPKAGKTWAYNPPRCQEFEKKVRKLAEEICSIEGFRMIKEPVGVSVGLLIYSKREPTSRPDCTNLANSVLDALTGICWEDDSQVTTLSVKKERSRQPRTYVFIDIITPREKGGGK